MDVFEAVSFAVGVHRVALVKMRLAASIQERKQKENKTLFCKKKKKKREK